MLRRVHRIVVWSALGCVAFALGVACSKFRQTPSDSVADDPTPASAPEAPPATPSAAPPASSNIENQPPLVRARAYFANGQNWPARFTIEPQALSPSGTPEEIELLAQICNVQGDEECVDSCNAKLGRKGNSDRTHGAASAATTDLSRARDYVAKKQLRPARAILEPKVLNDTASNDEIVLLKSICIKVADRMCTALCDAKLR